MCPDLDSLVSQWVEQEHISHLHNNWCLVELMIH